MYSVRFISQFSILYPRPSFKTIYHSKNFNVYNVYTIIVKMCSLLYTIEEPIDFKKECTALQTETKKSSIVTRDVAVQFNYLVPVNGNTLT